MWFAKLFGTRREDDEGEEPARYSAPPSTVQRPAPAAPALKAKPAAAKPQKGIDPYNSGMFRRQNAWERVSRR